MSETLERVQALVVQGDVRVSVHGCEELAADNISVRDIGDGLTAAVVVENYPEYAKGPCVNGGAGGRRLSAAQTVVTAILSSQSPMPVVKA